MADLLAGGASAKDPENEGQSERQKTPEAHKRSPREAATGLEEGADDSEAGAEPRDGGDAAEAPPERSGSAALADVAKELGLKPKELYAIEVPLGDDQGTVMSLGELKDYAKATRASEAKTAEAHETITSREAALSKDRELIALTLQEMGSQVRLSPQLQQRLEAQTQRQAAQQRNMMLAVMPELGDQAELDRFRGDVVGRMAEFSFEPHELDYRDYRALWFTKTAFGWKDELDRLKGLKPRNVEPKNLSPRGKAPRVDKTKRVIAAAKHGDSRAKTLAVSALLNTRK